MAKDHFHINFLSSEGMDMCIMDSFKQSPCFWYHVGKMTCLLKELDCVLSFVDAHSLPAAGVRLSLGQCARPGTPKVASSLNDGLAGQTLMDPRLG